jgi:hypothetical protein
VQFRFSSIFFRDNTMIYYEGFRMPQCKSNKVVLNYRYRTIHRKIQTC